MGWNMSPVSIYYWMSKGYGGSIVPECVASSIIIVGRSVRGLVRDICSSGSGKANRVRSVFPIAPIFQRSVAQ